MARPKGAKSNPHRPRLPFRQREIERSLRAAHAQGLSITRIDVEPGAGKFSLVAGPPVQPNDDDKNPWDQVLTDAQNKKRSS